MKVLFVNRYFFPDHSATSQILSELAFGLVRAGWEIHVVASRQLYEDPEAGLPAYALIDGVHVHRIAGTRFGRRSLPGRAIDYFSFYLGSLGKLLSVLRSGDVVVAMTDPPLLSVVACVAARLRGAKSVNWFQDVFPEIAVRLGVAAFRGPLGSLVVPLRNWSLRAARRNVVIGARMRDVVTAVSGHPPCLIPNWAVGPGAPESAHAGERLKAEWGLASHFVVGYSGNFGRAHDATTLASAIQLLRGRSELRFLFVGGGVKLQRLLEELSSQGLHDRVVRKPYQPIEELHESLSVADIHLVTLEPELEGLMVPSKFYGVAAAGRPVIFVGDPDGEIARLIQQYECGIVVAKGRGQELARAIEDLMKDAPRKLRLGRNARRYVAVHGGREAGIQRWADLLEEIA